MHMDSITMLERETCKLKIMGGYNIHFDHHPARTHAQDPSCTDTDSMSHAIHLWLLVLV